MSGHVPGPHGFDLNRDKDRIELLCWRPVLAQVTDNAGVGSHRPWDGPADGSCSSRSLIRARTRPQFEPATTISDL